MNNLNNIVTNTNDWLAYLEKTCALNISGEFLASDESGAPILMEWEKIDPRSLRLSEKITHLSDLLVASYSKIEIQFARKYPETVPNEMFLKSLAPLFENGVDKVNWYLAEEKIKQNLKAFLTSTSWEKYSGTDDIHFFVTAKDQKTGVLLGMIQFIATSQFPGGSFKVALYDGVMPTRKNSNLEKLLLSSIFKLFPATKRIFFHTRITNENAISIHQTLGFTQFPGSLANWIDLEYVAGNTDTLQKVAALLLYSQH